MAADLDPAHLQAVIDTYQSRRRLPSLVAAVYDDGEPLWTGAAGAGATDRQFRIGSITKTLTAVLVLQCRDEGLLDLGDPLGRFITDGALPAGALRDATVRQLLSHTAGLPSEPAGAWWERSAGVDFATLMRLNQDARMPFQAGEAFHYSNLGYALLGEVVARLRGDRWFDVLRQRVLVPLHMTRTSYHPTAPHARGFSVHHFRGTLTREPHHDAGAMAPAGQLWSTLTDLAHLLDLLLGKHSDVLEERSRTEMITPVRDGYGLGTMISQEPSGQLVGHLGSMPGFQGCALVDTSRRLGVAALTNGTTGFTGDELTRRLLDLPTPPASEPWRPSTEVPAWAEEVLGIWFWGNSAFEARWHNERLELHDVARCRLAEQFVMVDGTLVGHLGYHRGEQLRVRRTPAGTVSHLECATFIYTRTPYDPDVEIPGGHPDA